MINADWGCQAFRASSSWVKADVLLPMARLRQSPKPTTRTLQEVAPCTLPPGKDRGRTRTLAMQAKSLDLKKAAGMVKSLGLNADPLEFVVSQESCLESAGWATQRSGRALTLERMAHPRDYQSPPVMGS